MDISKLREWFSKNQKAIFEEYFQFLKFPSIGMDPQYDQQTKQCASWLVEYLTKIGLDVERWETSGQPVVFAKSCKAGPKRPTLLIYHHYDVQPVDPLELWETGPFEPTVRNGNVFARGAQDNKGQCFYSILAIKAFLELGYRFDFNLKLFIDGEEESGSRGTQEVLQKKAQELKSDYLLVVDSNIPGPGVPAITLGVRGILTLEATCRAADGDMHSGVLGGIAYNPNRALIQTLTTLWDEKGKVAVPHFYDHVRELTSEELKKLDLEVDEERMKKEFGLRAFCSEPGYTIGQSSTIRPTVEINGMSGGYTGEGFKTVIPAIAIAKISCRLVPDQDPEEIFNNLKAHLLANLPKGLELEVTLDQGCFAFWGNQDSLIAKLSAKAYEEVLKKPCKRILIGGSIPISVDLAKASGAETVLMGFALDSDQIHAPNEHFGLDRFEQGFLTMGNIFGKLNES